MTNVSIILPVYKIHIRLELTGLCLKLIQSFELILINDGSTDNTDEICKGFAKCNPKIKYFKLKNGGVSKARNYGLSISSSKYVCFIDSDDLFYPDYLKTMNKFIEKDKNIDMLICGYEVFGNKNKFFNIDKENFLELNSAIEYMQKNLLFNQLWNKIYKLDIIKTNNIKFDETLDLGEDAIFNIEYLMHSKKVKLIDKILYKYRIADNGLGFKYRKNAGELKLHIVRKMYELYKKNNFDMQYIEKSLIKQYISWIANISNKKNYSRINVKIKEINNIWKNNYFQSDKQILCNFKYKILLCLIKIPFISYKIGVLANIYDSYTKKKYYD